MPLNPERLTGWGVSTYVIMAVIAIAAFAVSYLCRKRRHTDLWVILIALLLVILCEVALLFPLGGTDLFFLEWAAYFGELLLFLPAFWGYLLGFLVKTFFTKEKLNEIH